MNKITTFMEIKVQQERPSSLPLWRVPVIQYIWGYFYYPPPSCLSGSWFSALFFYLKLSAVFLVIDFSIRGAVCGRWKSLLSASGCFPQRCGGAQRAPLARHTCPDKQNQASVLTAPQRAGQTILLEMWQPLDQLSPGKLVSPPRWAAIFGCCGRSKVCTLKSGVSYSVWHPWIS